MYYADNDKILRNKGKLFVFSIYCFLTSQILLTRLLSITNIIVLICIKRKNPEDFPEKNKEYPQVEYSKPIVKELLLGIILIIIYFSGSLLSNLITINMNYFSRLIIVISYYFILIVVSIVCFKERLKKDIKLFKENKKIYIAYILRTYGIMYVVLAICNAVCVAITNNVTPQNQILINSLPLWITIPFAIIIGPIIEEIIYRGVIRIIINNDKVFIIVSAIIFGLAHSIIESNIINIIFMGIPYAVFGGFLAHMYVKTNNMTTNIILHIVYNIIAVLLSILII